jgi:hypothetical protein
LKDAQPPKDQASSGQPVSPNSSTAASAAAAAAAAAGSASAVARVQAKAGKKRTSPVRSSSDPNNVQLAIASMQVGAYVGMSMWG